MAESRVVVEKDLEDLAELASLRPWQRDRLGYWFDHVRSQRPKRRAELNPEGTFDLPPGTGLVQCAYCVRTAKYFVIGKPMFGQLLAVCRRHRGES